MSDLFNLWTSRELIDKDSLTKTIRETINDPNRRNIIMKAWLQKFNNDDPFEFERKLLEGGSSLNLIPECIDSLRGVWTYDNDEPFFVFAEAIFELCDEIEAMRHDLMRNWMTPFISALPKPDIKEIEEEMKPDDSININNNITTPITVVTNNNAATTDEGGGDECSEFNYVQNMIADLLPELEPEGSEAYKVTIRNEFVCHAVNKVMEEFERQAEANVKKKERLEEWIELNNWLKKTALRGNEISQIPDYMKRLTLEHLREIFLSYDDLIEKLRYRRHIEQPIGQIWNAITPDFDDTEVNTKLDENDPPLGSKPSSPSTVTSVQQQDYYHQKQRVGEDVTQNIIPTLVQGGVGFSELAQRLQMVSPVRVNLNGLRELVQSVPGVTEDGSSSSVDLNSVCL